MRFQEVHNLAGLTLLSLDQPIFATIDDIRGHRALDLIKR
jgi:hypothetical protein